LTEAVDNIARTAEWLLESSLKASEPAQDFASAD